MNIRDVTLVVFLYSTENDTSLFPDISTGPTILKSVTRQLYSVGNKKVG